MNVLIIDNYDSFTFNLYQYIGEILVSLNTPFSVTVKRNNEISLDEIKNMNPKRIVISPGPGSPDDVNYFGICGQVITEIGKTTPLLGVCLGMQGIAHFFGGKVVQANTPMHGKTSPIVHNGKGVYHGLPQGIDVMRYHSLMVAYDDLPNCLEITSVTGSDANTDLQKLAKNGAQIMGIRHKTYPIQGVQYHPESFATEGAKTQLTNFLLQK
ncbi:glutamine amidotransferase of anthranilate synthase [Moraxella macacae 0408225]|uniref:Glutamine amidotransferase of anthranilate synthase n=1 Tax=Moraxella macacae 0408225 TaxID=1230338 RepID=L2F9G5_9GAMM|nr:aminodeoxychorismate/anthranilate synthase component II [Moraxella macacae]ELA09098.1 glutamine amidotransferase of anthranilate synthase [Moraxella macacae 0408225]